MRTGTIAAMPGELITTKLGDTTAYLAEARSIGGLSGSPVFTHLGGEFIKPVHFIGLVHGHYDLMTDASPASADVLIGSESDKNINMGIAIVVPSDAIVEVINKSEFNDYRSDAAEHAREKKKGNLPTPD
jgi:hypothetical protein